MKFKRKKIIEVDYNKQMDKILRRNPLIAGTNGSISLNLSSLINVKLSWWKKIWYPTCRFWNRIIDIPREVKWFLQRGFRGYSDRDVWSLYSYLSRIISGSVSYLKEAQNGHPGDLTVEEWDIILNKIILGFKRIPDMEENLELWNNKDVLGEIEEAKKLFMKYFESLWD